MKSRKRITPPAGPMLTHFTRASRRADALDNLVAILAAGRVRPSSRMIRGRREVVCFFDATLPELDRLLDRNNRHRYQPFGLAFDKRYAFEYGARPVIYLPWREAERILPEAEYWRVVAMEIDGARPVDWSFEREWRLLGDFAFEPEHAVALVENWRDAEAVFDRFHGRPPCAGVIPIQEIFSAKS